VPSAVFRHTACACYVTLRSHPYVTWRSDADRIGVVPIRQARPCRTIPNRPISNASEQAAEFARLAAQPQPGCSANFGTSSARTRSWWLTPIIIVLLLVAVLLTLAATGAAPFIYTFY